MRETIALKLEGRKLFGNDRFHLQVARIEKLRKLITTVSWNEQLKGFDMVELGDFK